MKNSIQALLKNKIISNSAIYMAGNILSQGLSFFVLPIFTIYLSPADYGIWGYTSSIQSFLILISVLSLNSFILRHFFTLQSDKERKELLGTIFIFLILFNIFLFALEYFFFPVLLEYFKIQISFNPYIQLVLVINILEVFAILPLAYFRITKKAGQFLLLTSSRAILTILLGLLLVIQYKMGVIGRYYGILYINLFFTIIHVFITIKVSKLVFKWEILKKGFHFSLPIVPGAFASVAIVSIDKIILERYVDVSQIGIFSVGVTLGTALLILIRGFYYAIEPEIYEAFNTNQFNLKIINLKNYFFYIILSLGGIIILFSKEIVCLMVSEQFYNCYRVIPFFVFGCILRSIQITVATTLYALNKTMYEPLVVGISLVFNILFNMILIPYIGIYGAAISSALSFVIILFFSVYFTNKFIDIRWNCLFNTLLATTICCLCFMVNEFLSNSFTTILIKSLLILSVVSIWLKYDNFNFKKVFYY